MLGLENMMVYRAPLHLQTIEDCMFVRIMRGFFFVFNVYKKSSNNKKDSLIPFFINV